VRLGVCFDLDGTLVERSGCFAAYLAELARDLEVPEPRRDAFAEALRRALAASGAVTLTGAAERALRECALPLPPRLSALAAGAVQRYAEGAEPVAGAEALLQSLHRADVPVAIVTNGPEDMQRAVLQATGLGAYAAVIVVSGAAEVAVRKPHPKVFWLACTGLGVAPSDALMVGDDLEADIRGAHRFGLTTCWIAREGTAPQDAPAGTVVASSLSAAAHVVREFVAL
jgi:putative hydrolase of the HAD superfamily